MRLRHENASPARSALGRSGRTATLVLAALGLALSGCEHGGPRQRVRLTEGPRATTDAADGGRGEVLRVGVASVLSSPGSLRHYRELIEYLGERLGVATEMVQRPSYSEMNELLRQRYCTVGFFCNYAFVRAQRDFGAELLATPVVHGDVRYRAYVITPLDSPARSILDLAGKRFAFQDPMCNAGWLYPSYRVLQLGRVPRSFFGSEIFTYDYEKSIRAVAEGAVDGAAVESPLYDKLMAAGDPATLRTRIVDRSPQFGTPPVVVHPRIDPALRGRLHDLLLTLHESARGKELLARIEVDRFVEADPELYAPVRAMVEAMESP
jgi:phosphonate transport system substrate-binding protein